MGQIGELARVGARPADDMLEAVFESLGPACVHRLVAAPHPFGLPPQDRRAAQRWLSRRSWARRWKRDLITVLLFVAAGLAAALLLMALMPALFPA